jgi:hypothetical protein
MTIAVFCAHFACLDADGGRPEPVAVVVVDPDFLVFVAADAGLGLLHHENEGGGKLDGIC